MLFARPSIFVEIGYYQGLSLILWIIVISLIFISGLLLFLVTIKSDSKERSYGNIAYGLFFIFFGIAQLLYMRAILFPKNYDLLIVLGYFCTALALFSVIAILEFTAVTVTRRIFSIIIIISLIIFIVVLIGFTDRYFAVLLLNIIGFFSVCAISMLYVYLIIKSEGRVRKKAIFMFLGIIITYIGELFNSESFLTQFRDFPIIIIPIIIAVGTIILTYTHLFYETV